MEKQDDEIYCPECGTIIKRSAKFCSECGKQIKETMTPPIKDNVDNPPVKSKAVAIVLAIFLGSWSWLYTYKRDFKKFWVYIGIFIIYIGVPIVVSSMAPLFPTTTTRQPTPTGWQGIFASYGIWFWLLYLSGHVWAFFNSVIRPEKFYRNYPNY
jgi:DNA-directed RNA polymerase subunit RPC12/RpoP